VWVRRSPAGPAALYGHPSGASGLVRSPYHRITPTGIGLYRRFQAKITAFNLARYFNHVLGREPLDLARYAV